MKPLLLMACVAVSLPVAETGCIARRHHHSEAHRTRFAGTRSLNLPDEDQMVFQYAVRDGRARLESDRVVLVFHSLRPEQQRVFHFPADRQPVQIAGEGGSSISRTCSNARETVAFHSDYANGTNTLCFGEETVRFVQGGTLLLAGDLSVDLRYGRRTVHVDGARSWVE